MAIPDLTGSQWLERGAFLLLLAILAVSPLALGSVTVPARTILWVAQILVLVLWGTAHLTAPPLGPDGRPPLPVRLTTRLDLLIPVLLLLLLPAMIFSLQWLVSVQVMVEWLGAIALWYYVSHGLSLRQDARQVVYFMLRIGAALSVFGILQYFGAFPKTWWYQKHLLSATYVNHNHFAGLLELILPFGVALTIFERDRKRHGVAFWCTLFMVPAFLLTLSRGAWAAGALAVIVGALAMRRMNVVRTSSLMAAGLVAIVIGLVAAFNIDPLAERLGSLLHIADQPLEHFDTRPLLYKASWQIFGDHWLTGVGPGNWVIAFEQYRPLGLHRSPLYAHSDLLQMLVEGGPLVLAGALIVWLGAINRALRASVGEKSSFRTGLLLGGGCALLALLAHSAVDFNLQIPANRTYAAVVLGLITGYGLHPGAGRGKGPA